MSYNNAEDLFFEADRLIDEQNIIEAKDLLNEILEDYPDYAKAHNHLGWIYHYKIPDYTKAEMHYKLALKYAKNYHAPYSNYSYFLIDKSDFEGMIAFGFKALKEDIVDKGIIYNQLAKAYELTSRLELAYTYYKKAKMSSIAANYIQEMNASLHRVKEKMNILQKIKFVFK
ncbi:hypothetical protein [Flavivirga sp. 57AJ16]|uniref:hypothetical protein n=1 Tax=Flavivirga sp. 57AJ16 TaxID=3025307 RepID=UPI002366FD5E|nr:hypothetical protein [Flavivirga sp. 57AJ16]MDD7887410.1 hypothetical protein [Flavivirga sp. 57AJ16]